ncbi:MAG TPA: hypothetical protein VFG68_15030, partial [Fimbriiglobus sp.]|nr:hypothetical protein [Fimbriiglobus sp.]
MYTTLKAALVVALSISTSTTHMPQAQQKVHDSAPANVDSVPHNEITGFPPDPQVISAAIGDVSYFVVYGIFVNVSNAWIEDLSGLLQFDCSVYYWDEGTVVIEVV